MHFHTFFNWLIILIVGIGVTQGGCLPNQKCYPEINEIFKCLELNAQCDFYNTVQQYKTSKGKIPIPIQKSLVFAYQYHANLPELIEDSELLELKKIFQLVDDLKLSRARTKAEQLLASEAFNSECSYAALHLQAMFNSSISKEQLALIRKTNPETLAQPELYNFLKTLLILGRHPSLYDHFELKLALIHYGLYLLNTLENASLLQRLTADYYFEMAKMIMTETKDYRDYMLNAFRKSKQLYAVLGEQGMISTINCHLANYEAGGTLLSIEEIQQLKLKKIDRIRLCIDIGRQLADSIPNTALTYYKYALSTYEGVACSKLKGLLMNYIGDLYAEMEEETLAIEYFTKARSLGNCGALEKNYLDYYNSTWQDLTLLKIENKFNPKNIYEAKKIERGLAEKIMHGDHLIDYYVHNGRGTLQHLVNEPIRDKALIGDILKLLNLTSIRQQENTKKEIQKIESKSEKNYKNKLLSELNEFKDSTDYSRAIYHEIFDILCEEYDPSPQIGPIKSAFTPDELIQKTIETRMQTLGYLAYNEDYLGYIYSKNSLIIFNISFTSLDSLLTIVNERIATKEDFRTELALLKEILLPSSSISPEIPLTILPDAALNFLPWHLLFPQNQKLTLALDLSDVYNRDSTFIDKSNAAVYSFDDSTTLASRASRKYERLKYGSIEAQKTAKLLEIEKSQLFAGNNFTKANLMQGLTMDMIHISSHSKSNLSNRLDNYVLVRDELGKPKKVFAYELEAIGISPKVVILSACETGIGAYKNGTGAYSLSRSFAKNGAAAIIKSLWKVNDKSTEPFMNHMYAQWNSGVSLGTALGNSRDHFKNELDSAEYYWAGFVLEGNPNIFLK